MPALRVAKHELFAKAIADGQSLVEAHKTAGYKADHRNASALRRRDDISHRVADLLAQREKRDEKVIAKAVEVSGITKGRILSEMGAIAFSDIRKVAKWGTFVAKDANDKDTLVHGLYIKSSEEIDDATAAAISEISQGRDGMIRVKFHSKTEALLRTGKELGMFADKLDATVSVGTPEQIERARAARDRLVTVLENEESRWHKPAQLPAPSTTNGSGQKQANGKG